MKYKYIFIIVTYKNAEDLFDFNNSLRKINKNHKVIIVDNFYNKEYKKRNEEIARLLKYDYISTPNKGYGRGNNIGIEYALKKYDFDYLIICNSDIIIKTFNDSNFQNNNYVFGPLIQTINGKYQNPYWVHDRKLSKFIMYIGKKHNHNALIRLSIIFNKIEREFFLLFNKYKTSNVNALHGSFVGFSSDVIKKLSPIYDENMFLYNEEALLSTKLKSNGLKSIYNPSIRIIHKEDGSTNGKPSDVGDMAKQSYVYYYEEYCRKNKT